MTCSRPPRPPRAPAAAVTSAASAATAAAADAAVARTGRVRVRHAGRCSRADDPAAAMATPAELADMIGDESARYALIRQARNPASPVEVDRWVRQTDDNPVFAVRFAHARLAAVGRYAVALGCEPAADQSALPPRSAAAERLRRTIEEYPVILAHAAERGQPHRLTRYLERLAGAARDYLADVRVLPSAAGPGPSPDEIAGRLRLAAQARRTLADGLGVLGVSAPERL